MREPLPQRRRCWTQKARIGGQAVYLNVGEYEDGRPGEIFVDISKQGTFLRGVMAALARTSSIALQCGADVSVVIHALRGANYPPNGPVDGTTACRVAMSVTDWIAAELAAKYAPELAVDITKAQEEWDSGECVTRLTSVYDSNDEEERNPIDEENQEDNEDEDDDNGFPEGMDEDVEETAA